ncbi:TAP-like protein-domain-containing protein [Xylariales sp. PMI_506]|nr:TAP-like protein-domain-containing protein [Xylariales sp. PMI_506]
MLDKLESRTDRPRPLLSCRFHVQSRSSLLVGAAALCFTLSLISGHVWRWNGRWGLGSPVHSSSVKGDILAGFSWSKIEPREYFEFHDCFDGQQCARLLVPMNWGDPSLPDKVAIAIVKQPAKVPVTDPRYGGPILLNPGGPGDSGVYQVESGGKHIQTIIDPHLDPAEDAAAAVAAGSSSLSKYFDIIGFDPRTVGYTTPHLNCFPDGVTEYNWLAAGGALFLLSASDLIFNREWARKNSLGASCAAARPDGAPNMAHFANTAQVVEDMLAIAERHGEWREAEAKRLLQRRGHGHGRCPGTDNTDAAHDRAVILERTAWRKGAEKVSYWGFSYGTVLGQTFAAMHPDRVARLILDGIVDAADYYTTAWKKNLQDTDAIGNRWSEYCARSGSASRCPVYYEGMVSNVVPEWLGSVTARLLEEPLVLPDVGWGPAVLEHGDVMSLVVETYYEPFKTMGRLFGVLGGLYSAPNATKAAFWKAHDARARPAGCDASTSSSSSSSSSSSACVEPQSPELSGVAIRCSDGLNVTGDTKESFKEYMQVLQRQSDAFGTIWSHIRLACTGWTARPAWTWEGPITGNTSFPILLIGNSFDPVTPLRNAYTTASHFPGSVVLHQDTEGHCSYSNPSIGTAKAVRTYFQTGELPAPGTVTEPEWLPFLGMVGSPEQRGEVGEKLWRAQASLALVWPYPGLPIE